MQSGDEFPVGLVGFGRHSKTYEGGSVAASLEQSPRDACALRLLYCEERSFEISLAVRVADPNGPYRQLESRTKGRMVEWR